MQQDRQVFASVGDRCGEPTRQPTHHDSRLTSQGLPGARPGAVGLKNDNVIRPTYAFLQRWDWDAGLPQGSAAGICVQVQPDTPRVDRSG